MGKVKSAIITTLLVVAVVVLALFSTVSWPVVGSSTDTLSSFVSSIHLGSDLTGEASVMLYPDGVMSSADYELRVSTSSDKEEFESKYEAHGGLYVEKVKLENGQDAEFKASIEKDAKVLNERFGRKGYSSYSTALVDGGFAIKITVPTNYTYAEYIDYVKYNETPSSRTLISNTVQNFMLDGELTLRNSETYEGSKSILPSVNDVAADCFKDINVYSMAGNYYVRFVFTKDGLEKLKSVVTSEATAYLHIGENYTGFSLTEDYLSNISGTTLMLSPNGSNAAAVKSSTEDYAILFNTAINGQVLANSYNNNSSNSDIGIITLTPTFGTYAPVYVFVTVLLVLVAVAIYSIIKYKKLGLVNTLMSVIYALTLVIAIMLIEIQVTVAGVFAALLGLALLNFANFSVFETVRKESALGRTIQASVKAGYKKTLWSVLDLHIVLVVAALMFTLIGFGEIASCGFIFFIATLASYILYWFTRFIWFVTSSPAKDKYKFCGISREVYDED